MKQNKLLLVAFIFLFITGCVQKSGKKIIILKLDVGAMKNIKIVGIRGNEKPLSWDADLELKPIVKDSIFSATYSLVTGYKFTEVKFTVNGQFELNEKDNRKIIFATTGDTTIYEAKFDVIK